MLHWPLIYRAGRFLAVGRSVRPAAIRDCGYKASGRSGARLLRALGDRDYFVVVVTDTVLLRVLAADASSERNCDQNCIRRYNAFW